MAVTVHNISGEITNELLAAGENVDVSSVSLCNTHATLSCTVNLFMEQKTTASVTGGTFHIFKNTLLPAGSTITHNFKFDNSIFGLFYSITVDSYLFINISYTIIISAASSKCWSTVCFLE